MKDPTKLEKKKEFPQGKESYCPICYFENDKVILRKDCPHSKHAHNKALSCDCCDRPIQTYNNMGVATWIDTAFQKGTVGRKGKELGTWCSEECYQEYFKNDEQPK